MNKKILIGLIIILSVFSIGCSKNKEKVVEGVTMTIKEGTLTNTSATVVITDKTNKKHTYGQEFRIDKKENGKWKTLDISEENVFWNLVAYYVDENGKLELDCEWKYLYGELGKGTYRIVKSFSKEEGIIYAEFTL